MKSQKKDPRPTMSCPCCDGEELELFAGRYDDGETFHNVACLVCGTEGPHGADEEEACRLWDAKHARHRIGERSASPAHAKPAQDVAQNAAAPLLDSPKPPSPLQEAVMSAAMASTESPAALLEEEIAKQARKSPFFALGAALLAHGA